MYHKLNSSIVSYRNGSSSPVLTATPHSYGSLRLSDILISALETRPKTNLHTKWLKRRGFTQGCAFFAV